jgi:hypothetical protein
MKTDHLLILAALGAVGAWWWWSTQQKAAQVAAAAGAPPGLRTVDQAVADALGNG